MTDLDVAVAESVFGLVRCTNKCHANEPEWRCYAQPESPSQGAELRAYSSDISEAWKVVEHLRGRFDLVLNWGRPPEAAFIPIDAPYAYDPMENAIRAAAASVPEAICLAALKVASANLSPVPETHKDGAA